MKILLAYIGKPRDAALNAFAQEFVRRSGRYGRCEMREIPDRPAEFAKRHASAFKVLLDPAGEPMDSAEFTALVRRLELEARDAVFVVGGADGLSPEWRRQADLVLSLSRMTFPHELARAIVAEQVYRALTTLRGHPYPR